MTSPAVVSSQRRFNVTMFTDEGGVAAALPDVINDYVDSSTAMPSNSSVNVTSEDAPNCTTAALFTFVMYVGVFGVMCTFGLIGNTLSYVVLGWERHSHVATFLLRVMACVDNLFLLTTAFTQISQALTEFMLQEKGPGPGKSICFTAYVTILVWPLVHITQMWTVWITVLVAFNRYIAICWPYRAAALCTMKQARIQVVVLAVIIIIYNVPRFLEYTLVFDPDPELNCTIANTTDLKLTQTYNIVYENALYFLFVFFGPLALLVVLNSCLIREMLRARRRLLARQLPAALTNEDQEQNLTLVMIVIVVIFVVCQAPAFINQCLSVLLDYSCEKPYFFFFHVSNLIVSANSSVNFIVYCVFRRQFRQRLRACCSAAINSSRYQEYNSSLQHHSSAADNLPLKFHHQSSRAASIQLGVSGGNHHHIVGEYSRSASMQIGSSSCSR